MGGQKGESVLDYGVLCGVDADTRPCTGADKRSRVRTGQRTSTNPLRKDLRAEGRAGGPRAGVARRPWHVWCDPRQRRRGGVHTHPREGVVTGIAGNIEFAVRGLPRRDGVTCAKPFTDDGGGIRVVRDATRGVPLFARGGSGGDVVVPPALSSE